MSQIMKYDTWNTERRWLCIILAALVALVITLSLNVLYDRGVEEGGWYDPSKASQRVGVPVSR